MVIAILPSFFSIYIKTIRHHEIQVTLNQANRNSCISVVLSKADFVKQCNLEEREIYLNNRMYDIVEIQQISDSYKLILEIDELESAVNTLIDNSSKSNSSSNISIPMFDAKFCEILQFQIEGMESVEIKYPEEVFMDCNQPMKAEFHPPEFVVS